MVDPPRIRPPLALRAIAFLIASTSKPRCEQKFESSPPMAARAMSGSIEPIDRQRLTMPRPATASPIIVTVIGGGTNL